MSLEMTHTATLHGVLYSKSSLQSQAVKTNQEETFPFSMQVALTSHGKQATQNNLLGDSSAQCKIFDVHVGRSRAPCPREAQARYPNAEVHNL